jgi:uncharacterized membrane protein
MNLSDKRWSKFKQELIPIIYLSILQTGWNFNRPLIMRFKSPWSIILATIMSIVGIMVTAYGFTFADTFAPYFNLHHLDAAPYSETLKKIHRTSLIIVVHIILFVAWYKDFYRMSSVHYAISYVICLTTCILFYRAMRSEPIEQ